MNSPELSACIAPRLDRFFWIAVIIAAAIVIPRSILITRAHSPVADAQFHLRRGLYYLTGEPPHLNLFMEDGLVGQALNALPMLLSGSTMDEPIHPQNMPGYWTTSPQIPLNPAQRFAQVARQDVLFGHALSPDALLMRIAIWKAILFLPFAAIVFHWSRWLYGLHAGCLALAMLLIDPTFAAHIPVATIDVLSAETIVLACFVLWLWVRKPSPTRLILVAFASAFALLTKQIAVVIPIVAAAYALIWWLPPRADSSPKKLRLIFNQLMGFFLLALFFLWALCKFDVSMPSEFMNAIRRPAGAQFSFAADVFYPMLQHPWPAGQYVAAFINSVWMDLAGRWAFLLGHAKVGGWWYYYLVLLGLKAPLGFFAVFLLALYSLRRRKPFFEEWSLLLPALAWGLLLLTSRVNIGFRHFLPEYAFILMLASRCVISSGGFFVAGFRAPKNAAFIAAVLRTAGIPRCVASRPFLEALSPIIAWAAMALSAASALAYHPDYLSYINWPYEKPWMLMNDSNIDWGQGLKETRQWLDDHPAHGRPVSIRYDWDPVWVDYYLRGRAKRIGEFESPPRHGLLIICPVWIAGYWDPVDAYRFLRSYKPTAIIAHSMLVYDLDHLSK